MENKIQRHWIVVNRNGYPIIIDERVPIYWIKKRAEVAAKNYSGFVRRCELNISDNKRIASYR